MAFRSFEQQGRPAGPQGAVADLGHFEAGRDRRADATELLRCLQATLRKSRKSRYFIGNLLQSRKESMTLNKHLLTLPMST